MKNNAQEVLFHMTASGRLAGPGCMMKQNFQKGGFLMKLLLDFRADS
ncbi:hypothetical protein [Deinococcus cellulosilyticus]|nr:hypothetical protein [Deinococcus cellulosilyticus]